MPKWHYNPHQPDGFTASCSKLTLTLMTCEDILRWVILSYALSFIHIITAWKSQTSDIFFCFISVYISLSVPVYCWAPHMFVFQFQLVSGHVRSVFKMKNLFMSLFFFTCVSFSPAHRCVMCSKMLSGWDITRMSTQRTWSSKPQSKRSSWPIADSDQTTKDKFTKRSWRPHTGN